MSKTLNKFLNRKFTRIDYINDKPFKVPNSYKPPRYNMGFTKEASDVLLVRHANTLFNLRYVEIEEEHGYGKQIRDLFCDKSLRNSELSEFGIEQCKFASKYAKDLELDMVIVSPLHRTMQTAYYLLRHHPQFESVPFVMHPGVREHVFGMSETTRNMAEAIDTKYSKLFKNLDIQHMYKEGTQEIDEIFYTRGYQPEVQEKFQGKTQDEIDEVIIEFAQKRFPRASEYLEGTYDRCQDVKKFVKHRLETRPQEAQNKKILIVTHSVFLKFWTGRWDGMPRPFKALAESYQQVRNCEFYADTVDFPNIKE